MDVLGEGGLVYMTVLTGEDGYTVRGNNLVVVRPLVEVHPVVAADDEGELIVGEAAVQCLQGIPGIGRPGKGELEVGGVEPLTVLQSQLDEVQAIALVYQVGGGLL